MNGTFTVTMTELINNTAEIANRVIYEKKEAIITRRGKPILSVVSEKDTLSPTRIHWNTAGGLFPNLQVKKRIKTFRRKRYSL